MVFDGFAKFLEALESRGDLIRIHFPVDPYLEITEIADRVMKRGGPALVFEKVKGSSFPLAINCFGSQERIKLALGINRLEGIGEDLFTLVKSIPTASCFGEKVKLLFKLNHNKEGFSQDHFRKGTLPRSNYG